MRRILPVLVILLPSQAFSGVIENASVVESIPNVQINNTNSAIAFGFQAVATHSAQEVWVYCAAFTSFGGNPRQYSIGLRGAGASGPAAAWLGGATNYATTTTGFAGGTYAQFTLPTPVPLTAGTTYFVVVSNPAGNQGTLSLRASTPNISRDPLTQAVNDRSVWTSSAGAWTRSTSQEPIFLVLCDGVDAWADATCTTPADFEGNLYKRVVSATVDVTNPATQTFFTPALASWVTSVEVPLVVTTGSFSWDLSCGAGSLGSGALADTAVAGPAGSTWFSDAVSGTRLPANALCTLQITAASGAGDWPGAYDGAAGMVGLCDLPSRASFQGANALLTGQGITGMDNDAVFRVSTCGNDCPDAGPPGRDAAQPGRDAAQPGRDAAQPGVDAAQPGLDADAPGLDAGGEEDAASLEDAAIAAGEDAALEEDAMVVEPADASAVAFDGAVPDSSAVPGVASVYGCGCQSAGALLPLVLLVGMGWRRRRP
jgi:uncharacterized protein (TIGR03382 family)